MLAITLKSVGNPDHREFYGEGVLSETTEVQVEDFAEASRVCRKYIADHDLGAGNWPEAKIRKNGKVIGRVSYNGKIWPPGKWRIDMKPIYEPTNKKG